MKLWLTLEGLEPVLNTKTVKGNMTITKSYGAFYPFRVLKRKLYNYQYHGYLVQHHYPVKKCEGCGQGYVEWRIEKPNYNEKGFLYVCKHCVHFYDRKLTAKRMRIIWDTLQELNKK
jgi:hypothetical protein